MKLKANPYAVFETGDSPIVIHAQRRWMGGDRADRVLAGRIIAELRKGQSEDGSWSGSVARTLESLYALWLLLDEGDRSTAKGVDWLLEVGHPPMRCPCRDGATYDGLFFRMRRGESDALRHLHGVPFTPGCAGFVKTGAALFFASAFGQGDSQRVAGAYESLTRVVKVRQGRWCSGSCGNNILLAFAVHPKHSRSAAMGRAVSWLSSQQMPDGTWRRGVPFFSALAALSHVKHPLSAQQCQRALDRLERTQNHDGSWGRGQPQLNTFLVLDATERLGTRSSCLNSRRGYRPSNGRTSRSSGDWRSS